MGNINVFRMITYSIVGSGWNETTIVIRWRRSEEARGRPGARQHAQRERRPRQPARERQRARRSAREGAEEGGGAERRPCPDEAMLPDALEQA